MSLPVAARRDLVAVLDALEHAAHAYRVPIADVRDDADPDDAAEASSTCTVGDAATLLSLSEQRVQEFAAAAILPGRRIGRSWLLDRAAVEHLAATRSGVVGIRCSSLSHRGVAFRGAAGASSGQGATANGRTRGCALLDGAGIGPRRVRRPDGRRGRERRLPVR